ncbi:hypothetical protein Q5688_15365 [Microcoleus sp. herbarium5]
MRDWNLSSFYRIPVGVIIYWLEICLLAIAHSITYFEQRELRPPQNSCDRGIAVFQGNIV